MSAPGDRRNGRGAAKMVGVAIAAFAFTFSLVPMYRIACE
jgi:cytochrome c oxidase assembly protein subunit 11